MEIPEHLEGFKCSDFFSSERFTRGFYDETACLWTFYPVEDLPEHPALEFLAVGRPGGDGIEWGYRKGTRDSGPISRSREPSNIWRRPEPNSSRAGMPGASGSSQLLVAEGGFEPPTKGL